MYNIKMIKKTIYTIMILVLMTCLISCGSSGTDENEKTEVTVFIAASLSNVMEEFKSGFEAEHEDVRIIINADSSGTLMTQILEGAPCDLFFSAGKKQMDTLDEEGLLKEGSRRDVVNNRLVVLTIKDSDTEVTSLKNIGEASSIALADGSVPAGRYTRQALINLGILEDTDDPSKYTTKEVSDALGGVEISEQGNVSKVLTAVLEGSCEVGTVYLSDTFGHEDEVRIIEEVSNDLTGDIIYPASLVINKDASQEVSAAASEFLQYITDEAAKEKYAYYLFDPIA